MREAMAKLLAVERMTSGDVLQTMEDRVLQETPVTDIRLTPTAMGSFALTRGTTKEEHTEDMPEAGNSNIRVTGLQALRLIPIGQEWVRGLISNPSVLTKHNAQTGKGVRHRGLLSLLRLLRLFRPTK
jgi:hypothetical protein